MLSLSLFHMTGFDLEMDFQTAAIARMIQAAGMAFLFVPINTAAYAFLPRDKNNAASGLMNLARNIGGSVGISVVTTMLDRRTQVHLNYLVQQSERRQPRIAVDDQGASRAMISRTARAPPGHTAGLCSDPRHRGTASRPCLLTWIASGFLGLPSWP